MHPARLTPVAWSSIAALALLLAGCRSGPDYARPELATPDQFRTAASAPPAATGDGSFADLGWWDAFQDPHLTAYIAEALTNNWDVQIAAARVQQAEASARITRADYFPTVAAGGDLQTTRTSQAGPAAMPAGVNPQKEFGEVYAAMSTYEVDLWGRLRRANEAARARLLATVEAQHTVRQALVARVATAYLGLLQYDLELELAQQTLAVRTNSLELTRAREQGGVASLQDVHQAQILVSTAEATLADTHRRIEQQENFLSVLLGRNPGPLERGTVLEGKTLPAIVPAGLPSSLLARRPDLRAAEAELVAANADIGQARAAFYPQLTLTGLYGFQSVALSDLFTGAAQTWQFGPAVTMPLFTGGRLRGNLKLTQARFHESLARYRQAVQEAFREVSDSLIAVQRTREFRQKQQERTEAHRQAARLAAIRYEGGVTSYLEVLYNEQELFSAELGLARARRDELASVIQLYQALGGGWTQPAPTVASQTPPTPTP